MTLGIWVLAICSISLSAFAQLLMKIGMSSNQPGNSIFFAATNPHVVAGLAVYGAGAILWLKVLSRVELSLAYPLVSFAFVLVAIMSWLVLGSTCRLLACWVSVLSFLVLH